MLVDLIGWDPLEQVIYPGTQEIMMALRLYLAMGNSPTFRSLGPEGVLTLTRSYFETTRVSNGGPS